MDLISCNNPLSWNYHFRILHCSYDGAS